MYQNEWRKNYTNYVLATRAIYRMKTEQTRPKHTKPMKNLSCPSELFKLVTSSLTMGFQVVVGS
jgi:hypothetical protein